MARILWADDEIESLKPHLLFLENKGFEVTAVNSGVEAIEKVSESKFDLIFLDENMPGISGLSTLEEIKKFKVGSAVKAKIISNDNEKIALSIREVDGNPYDEIKDKNKGDIVTCNVIETGDFGVKVRVGDKGPVTNIKKSELALRKADARPERWAKNDKLDATITSIDLSNYKLSLSIRVMEEEIEREAMEKYGSKDSGASLGAILGKALGRDKKEE